MRYRSAGQAVCGALLALACTQRAQAQAAPDHARSTRYYAAHSALIGGMLAGLGGTLLVRPGAAGDDFDWFPGDSSCRSRRSTAAADLSNELIVATVGAPVFEALGQGFDPHFANFMVVYGEATSGSLLLNGLAKLAFRRPRPYTYGLGEAQDRDPSDRNVSFYSGHSSTAFVTAIAGSLLFAESAPDRRAKLAVWGSELSLAAATANLRVRAGKHYYSDVVVGALVGTGLGVLVPHLHGSRYAPSGAEYAVAGGGVVLGVAVSQLLPLSLDKAPERADSWVVAPWAAPGAAGAVASGSF